MKNSQGNMAIVMVVIVALVLVTGAVYVKNRSDAKAKMEADKAMMAQKDSAMMEPTGAAMMEKTETSGSDTMMKEENMMKKGNYTTYSEANLAQAARDGKAVLFFHATWCPTCKAANEAFTSKADMIPVSVTVLKTDYDTYGDLKKKYGITYQHTFVQVDAQGNEIAKWNGGDIDQLKANVK